MTAIALPEPRLSGASLAQRWPLAALLLLGVLLTALVGNRYNVAPLAWVASVPWLLALRRTSGARGWLALLAALQLGTALQVAKIVTEPLSFGFVPMFSVPMALVSWVSLVLFELSRRRLGDGFGVVLFPAVTVVVEWAGASFSELGSWGALAYTQLGSPLMQTASLFGLWGISLLVAASSALIAAILSDTRPSRWSAAAASLCGLVLAGHIYGVLRLSRPVDGPLVTVAAVGTDLALGPAGIPSPEALAAGTDALFERTKIAAERGAKLVVWSEGATLVDRAGEEPLLQRAREMARDLGVDVVLAYVVPLDGMRSFENKYVWIGPEGDAEAYFKHHPVPGEGSVAGEEPLRVLERPYGRAAGAICYDYDFPSLAMEHAAGNADIVALPSSDWRGIDPLHGQMAAVRGIEGGFSVVRSVRWASSAVTDAMGRTRGEMSWFEDRERVLVARVPAARISTLYSQIGDVLPWMSVGICLLGFAMAAYPKRPHSPPTSQSTSSS